MAIMKKTLSAQEFADYLIRSSGKTSDIDFFEEEIQNDSNSNKDSEPIDLLLLCALPEERDRAFEAFGVAEEDRNRIFQDFRSDFNFIYQKFSYASFSIAVVTQNAMGMATATSLLTRAILAMNPKLVAMTGICAGRKDKAYLGDIIVADQVFDYTAGKRYIDKFAHRPYSFATDDDIRNYISTAILNNDGITDSILESWHGSRISHRISVHMKALASGTAVIDDQQTMIDAASIQDNLYAIDMESYGFALAATALRKKWIVIKAVQDYADGNKEHDETGIRDFSAYASAALLKKIFPDIIE